MSLFSQLFAPPRGALSSAETPTSERSLPLTWARVGLLVALLVLLALPRLVALDRFATPDEPKWLTRSANFYRALSQGDFAGTRQTEHPGVTVMWAGTLGYLWRYPTYAQEAPGPLKSSADETTPFLRAQGHEPLELLTAGRVVMVGFIVVALGLAALLAARLLGWGATLLGFALIALDPFHAALSRVLHLDGLLSSLMLLSLFLLFDHLYGSQRRRALLLSGVVAGLACLTKSPGVFLAPWAALLLVAHGAGGWRTGGKELLRKGAVPLVGWGLAAATTFVLFWPAMWVTPLESLGLLLSGSATYAERGHTHGIFFAGRVIQGDPGLAFYPLVYLWRTTPVVLVGLALTAVAVWRRQGVLAEPTVRRVAALLALWALLFMLFMSLGAQKFDRYLLPIVAPLDILAGLGWFCTLQALAQVRVRWVAAALALGIVVAQGAGTVATFPYYFSYYNPLLGGAAQAPRAMMVGWGEGLDEMARYLNAKPEGESLRVAPWYRDGPFSYFFRGDALPLEFNADEPLHNVFHWIDLDYVVLYVNQWQRQEPTPEMLAYFDTLEPEHRVWADGLEYARLYRVRGLPPPLFIPGAAAVVEWGGAIRLLGHEVEVEDAEPRVTFYLQNLTPLEQDLNVLVRLLAPDGTEVWRSEGWPFGSPTSSWEQDAVWPDGHALPSTLLAGEYALELGFYDPQDFSALPAVAPHSQEPRGERVIVGTLRVGEDGIPRTFSPP